MKWLPAPPCAMASDDGRYMMNRSPADGFVPAGGTVTYTLILLGKPWPLREGETTPRGWDGSKVLHVERAPDTPADRASAIKKLKELCE